MKKHALVVLALVTSSFAHAGAQDEMFLDVGLGTFSTEGKSLSEVKFAKLGIQEEIWDSFKHRFNVGGWLDQRGEGKTNAAFASYQLGFDVTNDVLEMGIFSGPGLISSTDTSLGGYFQFNETVYLGIRNPKSDESIGISYNHFSSAGLEMPNQGKDFMCLEIKFPF